MSNAYRDTDEQVDAHRHLNRLLMSLPEANWHSLMPHLTLVDLSIGKVLSESGQSVSHVYFPTSAVISLQAGTACGGTSQLATVGGEGMVGVCTLMGGGSIAHGAVVACAGAALRIAGCIVKAEFDRDGACTLLLLRYLQTLMMQLAGNVACARFHLIEGQLCRLILMHLDRLPGSELNMTHEQMSGMLGVRRAGVSEHASKLQRDGVIRYARGHISVLSRNALESRACACHAADRLWPTALRAPARVEGFGDVDEHTGCRLA